MHGKKSFKRENYSGIVLKIIMIAPVFYCCSAMYVMPSISTPFFNKRGEIQAELGANTNSLYANINYAFTNNLGIISDFSLSYDHFNSNKYENSQRNDRFGLINLPQPFKHKVCDLGIGYYKTISEHYVFETYIGGGLGSAHYPFVYSNDGSMELYKKGVYTQEFIQFNFGKRASLNEFGIACRLNYCNYKYSNKVYYSVTDSKIDNNTYSIFPVESFIFYRFGNRFKSVLKIGYLFILPSQNDVEFSRISVSLGLNIVYKK